MSRNWSTIAVLAVRSHPRHKLWCPTSERIPCRARRGSLMQLGWDGQLAPEQPQPRRNGVGFPANMQSCKSRHFDRQLTWYVHELTTKCAHRAYVIDANRMEKGLQSDGHRANQRLRRDGCWDTEYNHHHVSRALTLCCFSTLVKRISTFSCDAANEMSIHWLMVTPKSSIH